MANTQNQTNNSQSSIKSLILTAIILSIFTIAALIGFISIYISIGKSNTTSVYWNKYESNISNIEYPNWFYIDRDSLYVNKTVSSKDKIILYNLISMQDSSYCEYKKAIDLLAFKSYQHTKLNSLVYLILLISFIGCMTRSLHDFYGRLCFKDGIDLSKWWSWYSIRPVIALNIGIILFMLYSLKYIDLNTPEYDYLNVMLVMSFLGGFSLQDVISLLRKMSKRIFLSDNNS